MEGQDGKSQVQAQRLSLASETDTWLFSQILKIPAVCSCASEMQVTDVHVDIGQTATGARFSFQYSQFGQRYYLFPALMFAFLANILRV